MRPLNPVVPAVAKAYQDDPRYALAQAMIANGSSGAPTGSGSPWEGLARVAQALGGAYTQKKLGEHYQAEQEAYKHDTQDKTKTNTGRACRTTAGAGVPYWASDGAGGL
jgi:hypothetical protein